MLTHRLQFPFAIKWLHPIGVCICGIMSNILAIMKLFRDKKHVMEIKKYSKNKSSSKQEKTKNNKAILPDSKLITLEADGTLKMIDAEDDQSTFGEDII